MKSRLSKKPFLRQRKMIVFIFILALFILGIFIYMKSENNKNIISDKESKTTSALPTAQEDFQDGDDRTPNGNANRQEAVVRDNNGAIDGVPPSSSWLTSSSGIITSYSPSKSSLVRNGSAISGKSTTSVINFRLIDNVSGVIAQGQLAVVNGSYSGTLDFTTTASEGRLDIFNTQPDGVEENNIEIPVRFK